MSKNKGLRNEITKRKWMKRLKAMGIKDLNYHFKQQGEPCSCVFCSPSKTGEKNKYKKTKDKYDE